ncbi:glycoside hydrolase family 18 protein [Roridomyces roridus]|uniref:Glycoside hydrolase family 18 protein n=1 Tax=Roridomyces roridus TaxID=1738132 RepID=A0AAD7CG30_9AGAR|nr:glycoside hydrolase family 18 protein [Roridomyces roridus]
MAPILVKSIGHTTSSIPRPHIVYNFQVDCDGIIDILNKRYSEFATLHATLGITNFQLPPKRLLVTTFIPSAWVDDTLISERKAGLEEYLSKLLQVPEYRHNDAVQEFLEESIQPSAREFELEDVLPSTLTKKAADELLNATSSFIAASYYASWSNIAPEKIDYSKFDILFFAFAIPNSSSALTWDSPTQAILKRLVTSAKNSGKGTKIVLSCGGWTGSGSFHSIAGNSANRSKFVSTLSKAVSDFHLDGIDIDWEYPNEAGAGNAYGSSDASNFLLLLEALRTALGPSKIISAAVTDLPWVGSNGKALTNVSAYASELTYVNMYVSCLCIFSFLTLSEWCDERLPKGCPPTHYIQNYDINGDWSSAPGPNAPLGNHCGNSSQPAYTAEAAFLQWTKAGFPASKLLLGLPLYSYVLHSSKTTLSELVLPGIEEESIDEDTVGPVRGANKTPTSAVISDEVTTEASANLTKYWGQQVAFKTLVSTGALVKKADGTYGASGGFKRVWDSCSSTPFLYNTAQQTVVPYDDTLSLADKAALAKAKGMAGCFTWSMDQDDGVTLQNAIRKGLGK